MAEMKNPEKRFDAFEALAEVNSARLLEQFSGETIEDFQREILKAAASKKFSTDLIGATKDKSGNTFIYFVDARGILDVFPSSPLSGVHIEKLIGSETVALAYGRLKLEQLGVLTEYEIELLCQHIHAAGIL